MDIDFIILKMGFAPVGTIGNLWYTFKIYSLSIAFSLSFSIPLSIPEAGNHYAERKNNSRVMLNEVYFDSI